MWRLLSVSAMAVALGASAYIFVLSPGYSVDTARQSLVGSIAETKQLAMVSQTPLVASTVEFSAQDTNFNARFAGLLSHVRWLIEQEGTASISDKELVRINKQFESLSDDIGDSDDDSGSSNSSDLTVDENFALGSFYLSGDGDNEGILINSAGAVQLTGALLDTSGDAGTNGQVLLSTVTGTNWVATSSLGITGGGGSSLWTQNGSDIYFNTGNVGIGTTTPNEKLTVTGNSQTTGHAAFGNIAVVDSGPNASADYFYESDSPTYRFMSVLNVAEKFDTLTNGANDVQAGISSLILVDPQLNTSNWASITGSYSKVVTATTSLGELPEYSELNGSYSEVSQQNDAAAANLYIYGSQSYGRNDSSKAAAGVFGNYTYGQSAGGAIGEFIAGASIGTVLSNSTNASEAYGLYIAEGYFTSATAQDNYSIYVDGPYGTAAASGIGNNYGLYIKDQSPYGTSTSFNIYSAGTNSTNYFAGNVSIGSTSPNSKLTIQNIGTGNSFIVEDQADDTTSFVIDENGNIGVGVTDPSTSHKLSIEKASTRTSGFDMTQIAELTVNPASNSTATFAGSGSYIYSQSGNASDLNFMYAFESGISHYGTGQLTNAIGFDAYVYNETSGGITNAKAGSLFGGNSSSGTITDFRYLDIANIYNPSGTIINTYGLYIGDLTTGTQTNTPYSIYASDAGTYNYFGGNVGIGTTTPDQELHIYKTNSPELKIQSGSTGNADISLYGYRLNDNSPLAQIVGYNLGTDDVARIAFYRDGNDDAGSIRFSTQQNGSSLSEKMRLDSYGRFGIGTTTPQQKLQVFGDIRVGTAGSNGCIEDYGGGVIMGSCSSDERLKTNVLSIEDDDRSYLEGIVALAPVHYKWNNLAANLYGKNASVENLGLIAQDVEEVFPELVSRNDEGYRQVDFRALPFYLIEAIKELWEKVSGNTEKIETLEERIEALEAQLGNESSVAEPEEDIEDEVISVVPSDEEEESIGTTDDIVAEDDPEGDEAEEIPEIITEEDPIPDETEAEEVES